MIACVQELESKDANEILVRSSPKEVGTLRNKLGLNSGGSGMDRKLNPDTAVTKYCQFPPEVSQSVVI